MAVYCKCAKEKEKQENKENKENEQLFKGSYLRNGWCDILQVWYVYVVSSDMRTPAQQIWSCSDKR